MSRRHRRIVSLNDAPEERQHAGTRSDRSHKMDAGTRFRYGLVIIITVIAAYAAQQAFTTARQVRADERGQLANRIRNVLTWCDALDQQGQALRAYVGVAQRADPNAHLPALKLTSLNCQAIAHRTLKSSRS